MENDLKRFEQYLNEWKSKELEIKEFRNSWLAWFPFYLVTGFYEFHLINQMGKLTREYEEYLKTRAIIHVEK